MDLLLIEAGFTGVENVDGVIYARSNPALPEFTAAQIGADWWLSFVWPLRASAVQCAHWTAAHPMAPMDIHNGEARISLRASRETLPLWADLVQEMVALCTEWRRETRQRDEGM